MSNRNLVGSHFGTYAATVQGGRVSLSNNGIDAANYGLIKSFEELLTSPLRIKRPSVRASFLAGDPDHATKRGRDQFVEVSWEEALDLTARHLGAIYAEHGAASVFGGSYGWASAGRFHHAQSQLHRFLNTLGGYTGSRNTYSHGAAEVLLPHIIGSEDEILYQGTTWPVIADHTEVIMAFGGLPVQTGMIAAGGTSEHTNDGWIRECAKRGVRLITIGPMTSAYDDLLASDWVSIRPNTDTALMLALAYTLYENGWHDAAFLASHTVGFERFLPYLLGKTDGVAKTAAWAADICGVPEDIIIELAEVLYRHRCLLTSTFALQRAEHGEQPFFMLVVLAAMLGQIGLPGGGLSFGLTSFDITAKPFARIGFGAFPQGTNPIRQRIPVACITDMLENPNGPYIYNGGSYHYPDIQAIYWAGGNPFHHHQDLQRLEKAWRKPKLVISNEIEWNATARHADIVLPVCSTMERNDIMATKYDRNVVAMKQVAEPVGQSRSDYDVFCDLARRLGTYDAFSEALDEMGWLARIYAEGRSIASQHSIDMPTFDTFWETGLFQRPGEHSHRVALQGFRDDPYNHPLATKSGKIEIFCQTIADMALADCPGHPTWLPPTEWLGAPKAQTFPLHLMTPQPRNRLHGQLDGNGVSAAAKIKGREPVYLSPAEARRRDVKAGDIVRVFNDRGSILCGVVVTDTVASGIAVVETGAWFSPTGLPDLGCAHGNPNVLTADRRTSGLARGCAANSVLVQVAKFHGNLPRVTSHEAQSFGVAAP